MLNIFFTILVACFSGDVKYDVGEGYEYGEGSAIITVDEPYVYWEGIDFEIAEVCIKVGGPGGGELFYPDPNEGVWFNDSGHDVSHVVLRGSPTPVTLASITTQSNSGGQFLIIVLVAFLIVVTFAFLRRD